MVPSGGVPHFAEFIDPNMLAMIGGRHTGEEFHRLDEVSGFRLTHIVPTESPSA